MVAGLHLLIMMVGMLIVQSLAVMAVHLHAMGMVDMVVLLLSPFFRLSSVMKIVGKLVTIRGFTSQICLLM